VIPISRVFGCLFLLCLFTSSASAQFSDGDTEGPKLGDSQTSHWQTGVIVSADSGPCKGIVATIPVPIDWPEQNVKIAEQKISNHAKVRFRIVEETVKQMVVSIPHLAAGEEAKVLFTYEVSRKPLLPPENNDIYVLPNPRKLSRSIRKYLGPSPLIESRHAKIKAAAKQFRDEPKDAWEKVEAIYDWVRDNVEYKNGPIKGALAALKDRTGDCEEMTSLFIAICRASGIPARTVWVPGHCYPEFYLLDENGKGHWFPCQAAGSRSFGGIPETRPILQKGDNFRPMHNPRDKQRYLAAQLTGKGGQPKVKFIKEIVGN